jgi:adenylate cyclase
MTAPQNQSRPKETEVERHERLSRESLIGIAPGLRFGRRFLRSIPSDPRCKLCASPFGGAGGPFMRLIGKAPWPSNPKYCSSCFKQLMQQRGGAEIECSLLFADVRDSTPLAEKIGPTQFRQLMDRFFKAASKILFEHDAIVDKFVGDEVIGIFIPALTGELHAQRAIGAGKELLAVTGHSDSTPWVPIGVGINTGVAFVGTVGEGNQVELTALGDPVNIAARLASAAGAGEMLITSTAAQAAELPDEGLEHRTLSLKGKTEPTDVLVLHA